MKTVVPLRSEDEILENATRWILKLDEGDLSADDEKALRIWLRESKRNTAIFMEVAGTWDKTDSLSILAELFPENSAVAHSASPESSLGWGALAAASIFVAVLGIGFLEDQWGEGISHSTLASYTTEIGKQKTVLLPDSSEVILNTNTQLDVRFTSNARVLYLKQGEVMVSVAPDKNRPLSVVAGDQVIQAIGTEFVVEIMEDQLIDLLVTEGKVVVGIQPRSSVTEGQQLAQIEEEIPAVLTPVVGNTVAAGQQVVLQEGETKDLVTVSQDELEVRLSWKDGGLVFRSEPLEEVLREVERYTMVRFILTDESLKSQTLTGRFRADDVDALLASLRVNFDIAHEFVGDNRVVLSELDDS